MPRSEKYPDFPSVTEVLAGVGLTREYPDNAATLAARRRGQVLHRAIELHHRDRLDIESLDPRVRPYFDGYLRFLKETGLLPIDSEMEVVSTILRVVGHIDQVALDTYHNIVLVDVKSTEDVDLKGAKLQLAGYRALYEEEEQRVADCLVLQLLKNGQYRVHSAFDDYAVNIFKAAVIVFNAKGKK